MNKNIYVLLGPSGSGKTTLGRYLQKEGLEELVSHTTRDMRQGEEEGITYYFTDKGGFSKLDKVEQTTYAGNKYCLAVEEIERKLEISENVFVIMDRHGIEEFLETGYKNYIKVIYIKIGYLDMMRRLIKRDGILKALNRLYHSVSTGEFFNDDIADKVIINKDGRLDRSKREIIDFIK